MNIKDGDFGYAANVALEAILTHKGVDCTIFDKFIGEFNVGDTTFVLCHGNLIFINIICLCK